MRLNELALAFAMVAASPANAADYRSEEWEGFISKDKTTGEPKSCSVFRENEAKELLGFILRLNRRVGSGVIELVIAAKSHSWQVTAGQTYSTRIWIDGQFHSLGGVVASKPGSVLGLESYKSKTFQKLSNAREFAISVSGIKAYFPMNGGAKAIEWLQACVAKNIVRALRSDEPPKAPVTSGELENLRLDDMDGILTAAGLIGYVMVPREQMDNSYTSEWLWGQGGGRQYYEKKAGRNFDAVFADTVAKIKSACAKTKPSGFRDWIDTFPNGTAFGRSDFYCVDERGELRTAITVIDADAKNIVVVHYGAVAADVDKADERVNFVLDELYQ